MYAQHEYLYFVCVGFVDKDVIYVFDTYMLLIQFHPDGLVTGMRMDRGVSMPNMLEPKASAEFIPCVSQQCRVIFGMIALKMLWQPLFNLFIYMPLLSFSGQ